MMENGALIVAEKLDVAVVFSDKGMSKLLDEIKTKVIAHVPDISNEQGRKDIISLAYKITRSKTLIDDLGKGVVADWKKKAKLIDEHRKTARDFLDDLKQTARQPLTDWEAEQAIIKEKEEAAAKKKIQARVDKLFAVNVVMSFMDIALLDDNSYEKLLAEKTEAYRAEQLRLEKEQKAKEVEAERLEQLAREQSIEAARLAKINEEQEAIAKTQKAKEEALKAQEKAIEDQKRAAIERQEQIAWQAHESERLRILAEAEAKKKIAEAIEYVRIVAEEAETARLLKETAEKERVEREAREKKEMEEAEKAEIARQLELASDKEKLLLFADKIQALTEGNLSLKSKKARSVFSDTIKAILGAAEYIRIETKKL